MYRNYFSYVVFALELPLDYPILGERIKYALIYQKKNKTAQYGQFCHML